MSVVTEQAAFQDRSELDLVIVTGISGGGRSTVARALENVGYYVVDNLPESLVAQTAELAAAGGPEVRRTAMVLDVRSRAFTTDLVGVVEDLRKAGFKPHLVFVDADDDVIIRRFEKVRRAHPLQGDGLLGDGIAAERRLLASARESADTLFDTTHLNENQLRARVEEAFLAPSTPGLQFTCMSFGFKYGIPLDADIVLDLRFLPNPYWDLELRPFNGRDAPVREYVLRQPGASEYLDAVVTMLRIAVQGYLKEGRRHLTVAMGCTGGKHRSVAATEELVRRLGSPEGVQIAAFHRDLGRE